MTEVADFCGPPLVLGEIYGARSFAVHKETGELGAEFSAYTWTPGVNNSSHSFGFYKAKDLGSGAMRILAEIAEQCPGPAVCSTCGFYAYTKGTMVYGTVTDSVYGVVKGWGVTQVGTKGFRASKAEIVALYRPDPEPKTHWGRTVRWVQRNMWSPLWTAGFAAAFFASNMTYLWWTPGMAFSILSFLLMLFHGYCRNSFKYDGKTYRKNLYNPELDFDLVSKNYPNVKWYTDMRKMMSDYDLNIHTSQEEMLYRLLYGAH